MSERRKINRSNLKGLINYYGSQKAAGRNISLRGICIISKDQIGEGTTLFLKTHKNKAENSQRVGIATRCKKIDHNQYEVGIKFIDKKKLNINSKVKAIREQVLNERRNEHRSSHKGDVYYSPFMSGIMKNYTDNGLCLHSTQDLQVNDSIYLLKSMCSKNQLMIKGKVVWHKPNKSGLKESGIQFKNVKVVQKSKLMNIISQSISQNFDS